MSTLTFEPRPYLPFPLVREVFLESGSGEGNTLAGALEAGFVRLWSCDTNRDMWEHCRKRFESAICNRHMSVWWSDSLTMLEWVLDHTPVQGQRATIWLDGHYMGEPRAWDRESRRTDCPLLRELEIILRCPWKTPPTIVIDDYAMFLPSGTPESFWDRPNRNPNFHPYEWPTLNQIQEALSGYTIVKPCGEDILYAFQDTDRLASCDHKDIEWASRTNIRTGD